LLKFKANDREVERERRHAAMERDRESKYAKKLADWLDREASKQKYRERTNEKVAYRPIEFNGS
jgi:hypothetical protein